MEPWARARVSGLVAIDLAPFCMDFSEAQLLQTLFLLSGKRCASSDLSHFVAISISKTARSRTLQMPPYEKGTTKRVTGFTLTLEEAVPFDMVAYGRNLMLKASAGSFPTIDLLYDYRSFLTNVPIVDGSASFRKMFLSQKWRSLALAFPDSWWQANCFMLV